MAITKSESEFSEGDLGRRMESSPLFLALGKREIHQTFVELGLPNTLEVSFNEMLVIAADRPWTSIGDYVSLGFEADVIKIFKKNPFLISESEVDNVFDTFEGGVMGILHTYRDRKLHEQ